MTLPEFKHPTLLFEHLDYKDRIAVFENDTYRWIQTGDGNVQSAMNKKQANVPVLPYFPALLASLLFSESPASCLVVGLGGGELIRFFNYYLPHTKLMAIENSDAMINIFKKYFNMQDTNFNLVNDDICTLTQHPSGQQHDLVIVDVFGHEHLPACFYQQQLYDKLRLLIADNGVLAINLVVKSDNEAFELLKLIRLAFQRKTLCLSVDQHMNLIVLAFKQAEPSISIKHLEALADKLSETMAIDFKTLVDNICTCNPNNGSHLLFP